jgi:PAN domain
MLHRSSRPRRPLPAPAVLAFTALALAVLPAAPATAQRLSEERGYDYRGGDYHDFRARGVGSCKQECRDDRRCLAYSYNLRTDTCYLKDRVGDFQRNGDTVAGVKDGGRGGKPGSFAELSEERGYDYRGGDYDDFRTRGVGECQDRCREDRRCLGYAYNLRTSTCYLKDRIGSLQRNSDTVAGLKGGTRPPLPGRPPSPPGGGGDLSEEEGYDYKGHDYADFPARGADGCKAECRRDARCRAYAYNLRTGTCYLKDRVAPRQRNSETVAGVKGEGTGWPGPGGGDFREIEGVDSRGGDYDDFRARGATACREECQRDRRCRAYTFNRSSETCYLKDRGGELRPNRDTVSGIRQDR